MCTSNTTPSSASLRPITSPVGSNDTRDDTRERTSVAIAAAAAATARARATAATEPIGTTATTPTPITTCCRSNSSESNARREKRRFFRRNRTEDRSQNGSSRGCSGGTTQSLASESDDDSGDTVHSLPNEPPHMISSNMISSPPPTTTPNTNNNNNRASPATHHVPSPSVPGAVAARGRAFGDLPHWARIPSRQRGNPATPSSTTPTPTSANNPTTPTTVYVPRRSISERSRGAFVSLYNPSRLSRATSHGSNQGPQRALLNHRTAGSSFFGNVGNLFSSFRLSGQQLPEAEILDSEKVVYAEVVEFNDPAYGWMLCTPALLVYSIVLLLVGIMIGRWTVESDLSFPFGDTEL